MTDDELDERTAKWLEAIGDRIRQHRTEGGMTQEQLAGATGIDYKRVQRIEGGAANVTVRTLVRVAAALDVDLADLVAKRPKQ